MKWEWIMTFQNNTESFRSSRKLLDRSLRPAAIAAYNLLLETNSRNLLTQVFANPDQLQSHLYQFVPSLWPHVSLTTVPITSMSGSLMLAMGYGYEVKGLNDPKIKAARKLAHLIGETVLPGALLVNDVPFCEYLRHCASPALIYASEIHP